MSALAKVRNARYGVRLTPEDDIDFALPIGVKEMPPGYQDRLDILKPELISELRAEQDLNGCLYRYQGYMTHNDKQGTGRLVMEFVRINTGEPFFYYSNVKIRYQRGANKGVLFKTGRKGRFWVVSDNAKLAKFWKDTFGELGKLSTLYRQMSKFNRYEYAAEVYKTEGGKPALKDVKKVRLCIT